MNWNNIKLGRKFGIAFGAIILVMVVTGFWAIFGIGGIVSDAEEVIDGNKLRADLEEKYVDHLLWANQVSKLLTDEKVTTLDVQTDHHKCAFGKWYYGEGRAHAEELAPDLKHIFDDIEEPHINLHKSAIKISDVFEHMDWKIAVMLRQAELDHTNWLNKVKDAIFLNNSNIIDVIKDPNQCNFGKWLHSDELQELADLHSDVNILVKEITAAHNILHTSIHTAENFLSEGNRNQARQFYTSTILPNTQDVISHIDEFSNWFENHLAGMQEANKIYQTETMVHLDEVGSLFKKAVKQSEDSILTDDVMLGEAARTRTGVIIFIVLAAIIAIILAVFITRSMVNPINKSLSFANKVAEGNLMAIIDIDQNDEIGELANSLRKMILRLKNIVSDIKTGSDNIAGASQQLSSGAQQISSGVSEQAAAAEEVSSSMEEMAANIQQNTENAIKTMDMSGKASNSAEQVAVASEDSMNAVRDIFAKINVVVEIAEKTDLLAINAAVEAARAGDQGRGFAVVAAEVRKLAERSQLAASEIVSLAQNGLKMTEESNSLLKSIVPDIQETSRLVEEIASASREQESGVNQVNTAVQQLSMVTQQNASSSEEMAGSSEEMAAQASDLERITQFFKLEDNNGQNWRQKSYVTEEAQKKTNGKSKAPATEAKTNVPAIDIDLKGLESDITGYESM
ncbi:methyl-accepting chemotaxis protein [Labilibacter marinus]|uniref:methyl-accepting chemotaxis protein n=1 Tax=Labilibacter marinus TaxID=1477105 RepID=UPI0009502AA9|nr:methyl-accepting chemotaxis protein [Labilibacter marinus]